MSFEGFNEYLCENGHYFSCDVFMDQPVQCPVCRARLKYSRMVDQTNGIIEGEPGTYPAELVTIGYTDIPKVDRLGNKYFTTINKYDPKLKQDWREIDGIQRMDWC